MPELDEVIKELEELALGSAGTTKFYQSQVPKPPVGGFILSVYPKNLGGVVEF